MVERYKFPADIQQKYFSMLEKRTELSEKKLADSLAMSERNYRALKCGKISISENTLSILEKVYGIPFPYPKVQALSRWRCSVTENAKKGGLATFIKYGSPGTYEGRAKGGRKALALLRKNGVIASANSFVKPSSYSEDLAEFVGILLGDGHVGENQWSITLNSIADKDYCLFVLKFIENLFAYKPSFLSRKDSSANVIYGGGRENIIFLETLGLQKGNKVKHQVGVPSWIQENDVFRTACLRGLIDTDGGIFNHKYTVKGKGYRYKKLSFANCSVPLINFVHDSLNMLQLHPRLRMTESTKRVWVYGERNVYEYLKKVGSHNARILIHGGVG